MAVPTQSPSDDDIQCPECEFVFEMIWKNDGAGGPEYCPRCGEYIQEKYLKIYLGGNDEKI